MNILQITGGEGSGKTTLATLLAEQLTGTATVMTLDRYRRNRRPGDSPDFAMQPGSIDWPLIHAHMDALARGERITMPEYDLKAGHRLPSKSSPIVQSKLPATEILVIEGLHYLQAEVESIKLFVEASVDLRRERVQQRDAELSQQLSNLFDTVIEPAYQRYTLPLRGEADIVLDGSLHAEQLADQAQLRIASAWNAWG